MPGDYIEIDVENGKAVLKPRKLIDPCQEWFWTEEWQKGESEAEADIANNRLSRPLKSVDAVIRHLDKKWLFRQPGILKKDSPSFRPMQKSGQKQSSLFFLKIHSTRRCI